GKIFDIDRRFRHRRRGADEGRFTDRDFRSTADQGRLRRQPGRGRLGVFQSSAAPKRRQGLYQLAVVERGAGGVRQGQWVHQRALGRAHRSFAVESADTWIDQDLYATSDRYQRRPHCIIQRSFRSMTKLRALQSRSQSGKPYFTAEAQSSRSSEYFLIKDFLLRALCVSAVSSLAAFFWLLISGAVMAQSSQSWEQILAAAKKEGMVAVIGPQGSETRDALTLAFQKKYPDIRVELQSMAGNQIGPKLLNELAAGRNSTDVLITGTTTALETLLPAKALVAVKPWLSGPNTQDPSKWRGGQLTFSDHAQSYNLVFSAYVKAPFIYNSQLVSGADFKSWKDLLEPKWQGKIALKDPVGAGGGFGHQTREIAHCALGKDFMRKIFALKDLVM